MKDFKDNSMPTSHFSTDAQESVELDPCLGRSPKSSALENGKCRCATIKGESSIASERFVRSLRFKDCPRRI